jgi:hypothetical protein
MVTFKITTTHDANLRNELERIAKILDHVICSCQELNERYGDQWGDKFGRFEKLLEEVPEKLIDAYEHIGALSFCGGVVKSEADVFPEPKFAENLT